MIIRTSRQQNVTTQARKEFFVVESRQVTPSGKAIRELVIFDNHPESLRLLTSHLTRRRQNSFVYSALALVLVLAIGVGMLWPLF